MLGFNLTRTVDVAVAVHFAGPDIGFLLAFNPRWEGYSFPSRRIRDTDPNPEFTALEAFREATGLPHRLVAAERLFYSDVTRESQRTGRPTRYRYHGFQMNTDAQLGALTGLACRLLYLPLVAPAPDGEVTFAPADMVTWTAHHVLGELVDNQNVAVAAVVRTGPTGREYLMLRNANYRGYFPVASRVRSDVSPRFQAHEGFRHDTGYQALTVPGEPLVATDKHHSPRFGFDRSFKYHVLRLELPLVDLNQSDNTLELALERSGALWKWVPDADLNNPAVNGLSPTIEVIRDHLRSI